MYLQTDDALRDDSQASQCGRVVCQTFSINEEILVERRHREGVHDLDNDRHRGFSQTGPLTALCSVI